MTSIHYRVSGLKLLSCSLMMASMVELPDYKLCNDCYPSKFPSNCHHVLQCWPDNGFVLLFVSYL